MGVVRVSAYAGSLATVIVASALYASAADAAAAAVPDLSGTYWATEYHAPLRPGAHPLHHLAHIGRVVFGHQRTLQGMAARAIEQSFLELLRSGDALQPFAARELMF